MKLYRLLIISAILALGLLNCNPEKETDNKLSKNTSSGLPETVDEAVDFLIAELDERDKDYLTKIPRNDLMGMHFGWGMYIRNHLKLWQGNHKLLESCGERFGQKRADPDDASGIIMDAVWLKLHNDLGLPDFDSVPTDIYFDKVWNIIQKAKRENRMEYLSAIPAWMYKEGTVLRGGEIDDPRKKKLFDKAVQIANTNNDRAFIGILYFVNCNPDYEDIINLLNEKINDDSSLYSVPAYYYTSNPEAANLIIKPDSVVESENDSIIYQWHRLSARELAVRCLGSLYERDFRTYDDFIEWNALIDTNYLLKWKYAAKFTDEDLEALAKEPLKCLEILILTKRFFSFYAHENIYHISYYPGSRTAINKIINLMNMDNKNFLHFPFYKNIPIDIRKNYDEKYLSELKKYNVLLSEFANKLTADEIIDALSPDAVKYYNENLISEGLAEYKALAYLLFATQYKKILHYRDKEKIFQICYYYLQDDFLSPYFSDYLIELMFRINYKKARDIISEYFSDANKKNKKVRIGAYKALTMLKFNKNRKFLEDWFWKLYEYPMTNEYECDDILDILKETNSKSKKLYSKIINDKRFKS